MAQSAGRPTLDLGSGHDLRVCGFEPCSGFCADSRGSLLGILPLSLSFCPSPLMLTLALSKQINIKKKDRGCSKKYSAILELGAQRLFLHRIKGSVGFKLPLK